MLPNLHGPIRYFCVSCKRATIWDEETKSAWAPRNGAPGAESSPVRRCQRENKKKGKGK